MKYNSFYGGRQGASFVIQEKFPFIGNEKGITIEQFEQSMIYWFKKGNGYKTVNYDEYVIIDTKNKNNPNNGTVYRRGYDYNNDMGGALYVGQIVGPSGLAPHVEIRTVEQVEDMQKTEGFSYRTGDSEYTVTDESIVPGKYIDTEGNPLYNDSIKWVYCSVRDDSDDTNESTAYIGFQIPYTVIDFSAQVTSAYTADTEELSSREDDGEHPFYEKWNLKVPKGIKGDAIKNLREDTDENNNRILVYDSINYDNNATGTTITSTIGFLNDIEAVNITEDGIITIQYSANSDVTFKLKYPSTIAYNLTTNKLRVTYTDGASEDIGEIIKFIEKTEIKTSNYHLIITYNTGEIVDLGSVKSDNGILIGENFEDASITDVNSWIAELNSIYPDGKEDGKIITAGSSYDNKGFYAFNYQYDTDGNYKGWYYLGTIGPVALSAVALPIEEDGSTPNLASQLPPNGIWFVTEE